MLFRSQISQGTLNRLRASVTWNDFPALNVTASFLGADGLTLDPDGDATTFINTLTGAVTSPEPYIMVNIEMHLLRTQGLAGQYKAQWEQNSQLGNGVVRLDSSALPPFNVVNCAIMRVQALKADGKDAGYVVRVRGYYQVNQNLYDA